MTAPEGQDPVRLLPQYHGRRPERRGPPARAQPQLRRARIVEQQPRQPRCAAFVPPFRLPGIDVMSRMLQHCGCDERTRPPVNPESLIALPPGLMLPIRLCCAGISTGD